MHATRQLWARVRLVRWFAPRTTRLEETNEGTSPTQEKAHRTPPLRLPPLQHPKPCERLAPALRAWALSFIQGLSVMSGWVGGLRHVPPGTKDFAMRSSCFQHPKIAASISATQTHSPTHFSSATLQLYLSTFE